jgi:hypothetical protein
MSLLAGRYPQNLIRTCIYFYITNPLLVITNLYEKSQQVDHFYQLNVIYFSIFYLNNNINRSLIIYST